MCLIISMMLGLFGFNMLLAGDFLMGTGASVASLFFMTLMIRHLRAVKKERGTFDAKDCLSCNTRK